MISLTARFITSNLSSYPAGLFGQVGSPANGVNMTATDTTLRMREFKLFQDLMYSHAGIRLSEKKHSLVQNRLRKSYNFV